MKSGFAVFFAVVITLGASWLGFVVGPAMQLGRATQTTTLGANEAYPIQRPGEATLGLQVYRANGCAACHTEQVHQSGSIFEVVLTNPGKQDPAGVTNLLSTLKLSGLTKEEADSVSDQLGAKGAKSETHMAATGPDISKGWGLRRSVAADFLYDSPVQLGSVRVGPDLANVGNRLPDASWQLMHLYAPQSVVKDSAMPGFKFLFEVRKIAATPSADALNLPPQDAPPAGYEVVPTQDAKQLVAYLLSLKANVPLYEAPFTPITAKP
jgi:cytochrome c oxidase cbb3-type subunit 2